MRKKEPNCEQVSVRCKWNNESLDFTPWLACNLDLLGRAVGLKLELVRQEEPIGPFSLDILAKETDTKARVAIENQLEWTDHSHLGQLLTYAAGSEAKVAIWIAPAFRYEHAEAIHLLNELNAGAMGFYGVRVEVLKTPDSELRPRFCKVVYPGGWNKKITEPPGASLSPDMMEYDRFFKPLVAALRQGSFSDLTPIKIWGHADRSFPSRCNKGIWYMVALGVESAAWVTVHIQTRDNKLTKRIFDELLADRGKIESVFTAEPFGEWDWRRKDRYGYSEINIKRDGSICDSPEQQDKIRAWMQGLLPRFKEAFDPRIEEIIGGFRDPATGAGRDE